MISHGSGVTYDSEFDFSVSETGALATSSEKDQLNDHIARQVKNNIGVYNTITASTMKDIGVDIRDALASIDDIDSITDLRIEKQSQDSVKAQFTIAAPADETHSMVITV